MESRPYLRYGVCRAKGLKVFVLRGAYFGSPLFWKARAGTASLLADFRSVGNLLTQRRALSNMALSMKPIASARLCSPCNVCAQRAPTVYATQQYRAFQSQSRAGISLGMSRAADLSSVKSAHPLSLLGFFRD